MATEEKSNRRGLKFSQLLIASGPPCPCTCCINVRGGGEGPIIIIEIKMGETSLRGAERCSGLEWAIQWTTRARDNCYNEQPGSEISGGFFHQSEWVRVGWGAIKKNNGRMRCLLRSNPIFRWGWGSLERRYLSKLISVFTMRSKCWITSPILLKQNCFNCPFSLGAHDLKNGSSVYNKNLIDYEMLQIFITPSFNYFKFESKHHV